MKDFEDTDREGATTDSRVMCPHCDGWFFLEECVSLDDCPVCGRAVEVKPAPAPLNEEVDDAIKELCTLAAIEPGDGLAAVTCDIIRAHLSDLTRRLAEVEAERDECQHELVTLRHTLDDLVAHQRTRAEAAEARVRELEAQIAASKKNERRWIAKGEEAIAERNAANTALEAIKKHQEIVAGTGAAQMSTTWKIADAHLRSIGSTRAALAATEAQNG